LALWHLLQSPEALNGWLPHVGVADSKWQLTLEHEPSGFGGTEVWLMKTRLYVAPPAAGELLMLPWIAIDFSRWDVP
jgi:hypothetical protein